MRAAKEHNNLRLAILDLPTIPSCQKLDPDIWFPEQGPALPITVEAKRLCGVCLVKAECLAYALAANERHGIWAGLIYSGRRKITLKKLHN